MRKFELQDPNKAREALRLTERQRDIQPGAALSAEVSVALTPGKTTLSGAYAASAGMMDPIAQLCRTMSCAVADVSNLEAANRSGDLMRALWVVALVKRFIAQAPALLARIRPG